MRAGGTCALMVICKRELAPARMEVGENDFEPDVPEEVEYIVKRAVTLVLFVAPEEVCKVPARMVLS